MINNAFFRNISLLIAGLAMVSCNYNNNNKTLFKHNIMFCTKLIELPENNRDIKSFSYVYFENKAMIFYVNMVDSSMNFVEIDFNNQSETEARLKFYIPEVLNNNITESLTKWLPVNKDTIFALSNSHAYLFNVNDVVIDSFPLYNNEVTTNYICFSSYWSSMKYHNGKLVVPASGNVQFMEETKEYFAIVGIIIDVYSKKNEKFGRYSNERILEHTSFTNPYDYFDIYNNIIVFSSEEDYYLYSYDLKTKEYRKHDSRSKHIDEILPKPSPKDFDYLYSEKYTFEEARYCMIRTCPHNNLTYRVVKHKNIQEDSTGLYKNKPTNSPYSIIVFDNNLKIIGEYILNEGNFTDYIIPVPNGIILPNILKSSLQKTRKICLDLYDLNYK